VSAIALCVLIKSVFVGKKGFELIKMHGKTNLKEHIYIYIYMFLADLSVIEILLNPLYGSPPVTCGQADEQTVA
jgi:hypothetical protein